MPTHIVCRICVRASVANLWSIALQWLCALSILAWAPGAAAHAALLASQPEAGAVLPQAPAAVHLTFNEPVSPLRIRLIQPDGSTQDITQLKTQTDGLSVALPALDSQGTYGLSWRVVSADGHPVGGTVTFSVGAQSTHGMQELASRPGSTFLIWLSRLGGYIGLFAGVGMVLCQAWRTGHARPRRLVSGLLALGMVAMLFSVGLLGIDALDEPVSALFSPAPWRTAGSTSFALTAALALIALGCAALSWLKAASTSGKAMAMLALMLLGASLAASGHAGNATPEWLARPSVWLHAVAVTLWIGSLLPLAHSLQGTTPPELLKRFSRKIPAVLLALFISGSALVYLQFDRPSSLWQTAYGQVLMLKLALLTALLALGAYNRHRLTHAVFDGCLPARRAMRRIIYAECALALAILAAVALWRFTPPPRVLHSAPAIPVEIDAHIHDATAMADLALTLPAAGQPGHLTLYLSRTDLTPLAAQEVTVALSNPQAGVEPIERPASQADDGSWQVADLALPQLPSWHIRIEALISDFDRIHLDTTLQTPQPEHPSR